MLNDAMREPVRARPGTDRLDGNAGGLVEKQLQQPTAVTIFDATKLPGASSVLGSHRT